jgi:hypothetical protein
MGRRTSELLEKRFRRDATYAHEYEDEYVAEIGLPG